MKSIFTIAAMLTSAILLTSAVLFTDVPQDPPKKGKKHINLVRIDDSGKKVEIDTVLEANQVFVWNGDTIGKDGALKWISEDGDFDFDMDMNFDVKTDGKHKVIVMKSGDATAPMVYEFKTNDDSTKQYRVKMITAGDEDHMKVMKWHADSDEDVFFGAPAAPHKMMFVGDRKKGNVIDLSDPGIVSYEKKDLKDGKEKIVIVREKPSEEAIEMNEEIIINGAPMIHGMHAPVEKRIKVIAGDDGKVEILEDGGVWSVENMEEGEKVIEKDGKKIVIKKIKEGDEVKVNVEVEEKEEKK
ncbi:hypothetical protein [Maribellus sediminis]|uniref:hypothetical protein n=1 Tax=Maribellus sediminis TaxID=2696285 RepID=UPI0014306CCE|nr:hypothetical protein [Maribellus sediminis]